LNYYISAESALGSGTMLVSGPEERIVEWKNSAENRNPHWKTVVRFRSWTNIANKLCMDTKSFVSNTDAIVATLYNTVKKASLAEFLLSMKSQGKVPLRVVKHYAHMICMTCSISGLMELKCLFEFL